MILHFYPFKTLSTLSSRRLDELLEKVKNTHAMLCNNITPCCLSYQASDNLWMERHHNSFNNIQLGTRTRTRTTRKQHNNSIHLQVARTSGTRTRTQRRHLRETTRREATLRSIHRCFALDTRDRARHRQTSRHMNRLCTFVICLATVGKTCWEFYL